MPPKHHSSAAPIENVQILRGIAALAVVGFHAIEVLGDHIDSWLPNLLLGAAGVDVFFTVSGFMMVYSSGHLYCTKGASLRFLTARIIRIVPAYWILSTFYFLYVVVKDNARGNIVLLFKQLILSILFIQSQNNTYPIVPVGWTLNFEMFFYIIFSLFLLFSRTISFVLTSSVLLAFVILDPVMPARMAVFGTPIVLEFAFGMAIAQVYIAGIRIPNLLAIVIVIFSCLLLMMMPYPDENWWWWHGVVWGPAGVLITGSITLAAHPFRNVICRYLSEVGDFSYSLYLTHWILFNVVAHTTQFVRSENRLIGTALWVALVGAAILSGYVFHRFVDRPIHRVLKLRARRITVG